MNVRYVEDELKMLFFRIINIYDNLPLKKVMIILFSFSLLINMIFVIYRQDFYSPMTWESGELAKSFINGQGFSYSFFGNPLQLSSVMAPFYPVFLAIAYLINGITPLTFAAIQIFQAIIQSSSVVIMAILANRLFDRYVAAVSAILFSIYPDYIYGVTLIHHMTFVTFFILLLILYLVKLKDGPNARVSAICGAILGVTALTEPTIFFFIPFIFLWICWWSGWSIKRSMRILIPLILVMSLLITPWTLRNYSVHDDFLLIKCSGFNFWRGNYPPGIYTGIPNLLTDAPKNIQYIIKNSSELGGDRILQEEAIEFIKNSPKIFIISLVKKAYYFWWSPPEGLAKFDTAKKPFYEVQTGILRKIIYAPVLILAVFGLINSLNRRRDLIIVYFLFIGFTIGYSIFFIMPRYRVSTIQLFIIIFASYTIVFIAKKIMLRKAI
jgi:4-amino-4-deoxy-L-arabinose transferase-like glycosyltransferase